MIRFLETKKTINLCVTGFFYKLLSTFGVILAFSSFLKIAGKSNLPFFYITFAISSIILGTFLFFRENYKSPSLSFNFWVCPILAVVFGMAAQNYNNMDSLGIFVVYTLIMLFDTYFGIIFWAYTNSCLSVKEIQKNISYIAGMTFLGGVVTGVSFKYLFELVNVQMAYKICAIFFLFFPIIPYLLKVRSHSRREVEIPFKKTKESSVREFFAFPLSGVISAILAASAFIHYGLSFKFSSAISMNFTNAEEIAVFTGAFESAMILVVFLLHVTLLPYLVNIFSPPSLLKITPVILVLGAIFMLFVPSFWGIVVFQFVIQVFMKVLDQNIFRLLFNVYDRKIRHKARFISDGVIFATAVAVTGVLLVLFEKDMEAKLLYLCLIAIGFIYLYLCHKTRQKYSLAIANSLKAETSIDKDDIDFAWQGEILDKFFEKEKINSQPLQNRPGAILRLSRKSVTLASKIVAEFLNDETKSERLCLWLKVAGRIKTLQMAQLVPEYLNYEKNDKVLEIALESSYRLLGADFLEKNLAFLNHKNNRVKGNAILATLRIANDEATIKKALLGLKDMIFSVDINSRITACNILGELKSPTFFAAICYLLKDSVAEVKHAAINAIARFKKQEVLPILEDIKVRQPEFSEDIDMALAKITESKRDKIEELIASNYNRSSKRIRESLNRLKNDNNIEVAYQLALRFPDVKGLHLIEFLADHSNKTILAEVQKAMIPYDLDSGFIANWILDSKKLNLHDLGIYALGAVSVETFKEVVFKIKKSGFDKTIKKHIFLAAGHRILDPDQGLLIFKNLFSKDKVLIDMARELIEQIEDFSNRELFSWLDKNLI